MSRTAEQMEHERVRTQAFENYRDCVKSMGILHQLVEIEEEDERTANEAKREEDAYLRSQPVFRFVRMNRILRDVARLEPAASPAAATTPRVATPRIFKVLSPSTKTDIGVNSVYFKTIEDIKAGFEKVRDSLSESQISRFEAAITGYYARKAAWVAHDSMTTREIAEDYERMTVSTLQLLLLELCLPRAEELQFGPGK